MPADKAAGRVKGRIYVYFANGKTSTLYRCWSDIDNNIFPGNTSNLKKVDMMDIVSKMSQTSVYPNLIYPDILRVVY